MDNLCPFFKESCHGNQCKMWHNEECLIVALLQLIQEKAPTSEETMPSPQEPIERTDMFLHREEEETQEAPDWLKTASLETLAKEIMEFKESKFPEIHVGLTFRSRSDFHNFLFNYWSQKGVSKYSMSPEIQRKINEAESLAEKELVRKEQAEKKKRLEKENGELSSLVSQFVDWARPRSIKRAILTEVEQFVLDKDIDILKETKRAIIIMANAKLKSRQ